MILMKGEISLKRLKKWSFFIILGITGIIYYRADESLIEMTRWESMESAGEEKPQGEWEILEDDRISDSIAGDSSKIPDSVSGDPSRITDIDQETFLPVDEGSGKEIQESFITEETETVIADTDPQADESERQPEIQMGRVEDDYFTDALFLGDSRTVGMYEYGELEDIATFYASTGLTIYKLFDAKIVELPGQKEKITVEEALQHQSFRKIYIMVGINEMGRGTVESFAETYAAAVEHLQELQPEAVIYIQAILKVSTARSNQGDYINNEGIAARNEALSQLADGRRVFYLDPNPVVCDEDGGMIQEYTFDGVHLKAKYTSLWKEFLKDNAVLLD